MMEDTPLFRIRMRCQDYPKTATAFCKATEVSLEGVEINALIENVHEVLIIEFE